MKRLAIIAAALLVSGCAGFGGPGFGGPGFGTADTQNDTRDDWHKLYDSLIGNATYIKIVGGEGLPDKTEVIDGYFVAMWRSSHMNAQPSFNLKQSAVQFSGSSIDTHTRQLTMFFDEKTKVLHHYTLFAN